MPNGNISNDALDSLIDPKGTTNTLGMEREEILQ